MNKNKNNQVIKHFEGKPNLNNEMGKLSVYDNEFASDFELEDRQLELQREQTRNFTKSNKNSSKSSKNKTAK